MSKDKLIDAALLHYSKYGYDGATMRKIANEVGIKPASIYFFYENKETLFIAAFKKLLNAHFDMMQTTLEKHKNQSIDQIFIALLKGIVMHHREDMESTTAYISLVTAPIPEIKTYLQEHMETFGKWLENELSTLLTNNFQNIETKEIERVVQQFNIIGNGLFWGVSIYDETTVNEQLLLAEEIFRSMIQDLTKHH